MRLHQSKMHSIRGGTVTPLQSCSFPFNHRPATSRRLGHGANTGISNTCIDAGKRCSSTSTRSPAPYCNNTHHCSFGWCCAELAHDPPGAPLGPKLFVDTPNLHPSPYAHTDSGDTTTPAGLRALTQAALSTGPSNRRKGDNWGRARSWNRKKHATNAND